MMHQRIATRLENIQLEDSQSERPVRLGCLWEQQRAVLIFVRHFG